MKDSNVLVTFGSDIKAIGDGKIGGYLVRFSDAKTPDLENDFFTADTDFDIDDGDKVTVYYHHGYDPVMQKRKLGRGTLKADDVGIWVEAQLELRDEYERAIYQMVEEGKQGWSSGTLSYLVEREQKNGAYWIKSWPLGKDATITPIPAAGPVTTSVMALKEYQQLAKTDENLKALLPESDQEITDEAATADESDGDAVEVEQMENIKMTEKVEDGKQEQPAITIDQIGDAMKAAIKPINERLEKLEKEPINPVEPATKNVNVITDTEHWKYDNIGAGDLALMVGTLDTAKRGGQSRRGASPAAYKALGMRLEAEEGQRNPNLSIAGNAMKASGIKANEINQSTLANYGDEWVGVAYSGELWEAIRHGTFVLQKLPRQIEVPQGAESVVIPLESTDPTWYKVAQAASLSANPGGIPTNTVTSSNLGTGNVSLTLGKMGARVLWTGEMEEDSVLPYVAQLRMQLAQSGAEYLESVLIDGDTEPSASTNINDIAGTPGGTEHFMILNGFRKSPLITTTANSRDGGALAVEDYLETVKLMGAAGKNALDRDKVSFIVDPSTHWKSLELTEVKTQDVFSSPTIENGNLIRIWGYEVLNSAHMCKGSGTGLSNSAGKVDIDTLGNNTLGQILAVRWDQWQFGWRRRMTIETTRVPAADSTEIVALMRFGMVQRDTEAAAISYNLTV